MGRESLDAHYLGWAERGYEELKERGDLTADSKLAYRIPDEMELPRNQCTISFQKSIYEFPGKLDALGDVTCWYRNPGLIAFTESGKIAVLEYKGEDRVINEDSSYKESLGSDWAALDPEHRYFRMVTKGNMQSTLKEIEEL